MCDPENAENVSTYLNEVLRGTSKETLRMFRARVMQMHKGQPKRTTTVVDTIDGLIALLDLRTARSCRVIAQVLPG